MTVSSSFLRGRRRRRRRFPPHGSRIPLSFSLEHRQLRRHDAL